MLRLSVVSLRMSDVSLRMSDVLACFIFSLTLEETAGTVEAEEPIFAFA